MYQTLGYYQGDV